MVIALLVWLVLLYFCSDKPGLFRCVMDLRHHRPDRRMRMNASPASDKWRGSFLFNGVADRALWTWASPPAEWSIAVAENHNSPCSAEVRCRSAVIASLGRELVATRTQEALKKGSD